LQIELIWSPKSSLIPNTAPAELAALLPIPLPALMPFMISISNPKALGCASNKAKPATPATLL